jgi:hypothetical protein
MPTDYYLEELPDGGALQPTDLMHVQRNVNGTWTDYQFEQGNVNGVPVYVHEGTYTEADLVGQDIVMFTPPAGTIAVFLPMAFVRLDIPSPLGVLVGVEIGSPPDQLGVIFQNTNVLERIVITQIRAADLIDTPPSVEVDVLLASSSFTLYIRTAYVLIDI